MLKLIMTVIKLRGDFKMPRPRNLTPMEETVVYQMHKEGRPIAEIAYKFNISPSTVQRIVRRFKQTEKEKE